MFGVLRTSVCLSVPLVTLEDDFILAEGPPRYSGLVDQPTQLIGISDIYLLTDKYKRQLQAGTHLTNLLPIQYCHQKQILGSLYMQLDKKTKTDEMEI